MSKLLYILPALLAVSLHGQSTSGAGFPSVSCSANILNQKYLDTTNNLNYTCVNISGTGYLWQLGNSPVQPVVSTPSGACTNGLPIQQVISTGVLYTCKNSAWAALSGGVSVLVTDPPYNAKCDGTTDDTTALQAAFDHGGTINLPLTIGDPIFLFPLCSFSGHLQLPINATLQGNGSGLNWTGTSGVGLTLNAGAYLINGYIQSISASGAITNIKSTSAVHISGWSSWGPTGNASYVSYNASKIQESLIDGLSTDGPVIMSQDLAIPGLAGMVQISNSNIGFSPHADYPAMLSIDPATSGVWSFTSVWINSPSTSGTACVICVTNSTTGQSPLIQFNNVHVKTGNTYTGSLLKTSQTGVGALPPWIAGSVDTTEFLAGTLFSGNWLGQLQVGATTYRGSAALLTYRCNGGTQAGLIYTNNTSCTGGTAVATGDSVQ